METTFELARSSAGLTRRDVAAALHCTQSYVRQVECGTKRPSPAFAKRASMLLGVAVDKLFPDVRLPVAADRGASFPDRGAPHPSSRHSGASSSRGPSKPSALGVAVAGTS